jgi:hypothetical protein
MALGKWMTREEIRKDQGLPAAPLVGSFDVAEPTGGEATNPGPLRVVEGAA